MVLVVCTFTWSEMSKTRGFTSCPWQYPPRPKYQPPFWFGTTPCSTWSAQPCGVPAADSVIETLCFLLTVNTCSDTQSIPQRLLSKPIPERQQKKMKKKRKRRINRKWDVHATKTCSKNLISVEFVIWILKTCSKNLISVEFVIWILKIWKNRS